MIYFMREGTDGPVKIGRAADVELRRRAIHASGHPNMTVIRTLDAKDWVECWFHRRFSDHRIKGEWFSYVPEMISDVPPDNEPDGLPISQGLSSRGLTTRVHLTMSNYLLDALDEWRRMQSDLPPRAEAIRRILEDTLCLISRDPAPISTENLFGGDAT